MKNQLDEIAVIGTFYDQPTRLLEYAKAASALGASIRFDSRVDPQSHSPSEAVLFVDETVMCEAIEELDAKSEDVQFEKALRRMMVLSDKLKLRQVTQEQFPHPFHSIRSQSDIDAISLGCGPWVSKPRWGSNSRDVRRSADAQSLRGAVEPILARSTPALLEKYITGRHQCIELKWTGKELSVLGVCAKEMASYETQIVEAFHTLHNWPEENVASSIERLRPVFEENLTDTPLIVHGEFVEDNISGQLHIAELNPRPPWGLLPEFFSVAHNIEFDKHVIANALGVEIELARTQNPTVLGMIYSEDFFTEYESIPTYGNTLFVERFDQHEDPRNEKALVKYGRFLLWGNDREAVNAEWRELANIARPSWADEVSAADAKDTWKSKCC